MTWKRGTEISSRQGLDTGERAPYMDDSAWRKQPGAAGTTRRRSAALGLADDAVIA